MVGVLGQDGQKLAIGTPVEVRIRFDGAWAVGFEVAGVVRGGYQLLRCRDGSLLPGCFPASEVRLPRTID